MTPSESNERRVQIQLRDRRPLAIQVYERLKQAIVEGEFAPGSRLPSESGMASRFAVSRITIREALRLLQRDMLIDSRHGSGHFVLRPPRLVKKPITEFQSVTELMESLGYPVESVLLEVRRERAGDLAETLQLGEGEEVVRLERLRTSDGEEMIYSMDVFPAGPIGTVEPDWRTSLLDILESCLGTSVTYSRASIRAATLPKAVRKRLSLPAAHPWILLEQVAYTAGHKPVLYSLDYHRGDRFEFFALRHRTTSRGERV